VTDFLDEFNSVLPEFEANFREDWTFNGDTFPAIAIESLELTRAAGAAGGPLRGATVSLHVRGDVYRDSGIARGNVLTARAERVRVLTIINDGDDAYSLVCGPTKVAIND
jgi:hypothetical protein